MFPARLVHIFPWSDVRENARVPGSGAQRYGFSSVRLVDNIREKADSYSIRRFGTPSPSAENAFRTVKTGREIGRSGLPCFAFLSYLRIA